MDKYITKVKNLITKLIAKIKQLANGNGRKIVVVSVLAIAVVAIIGLVYISLSKAPYAITVDGENVCYVTNKDAARDTIINIIQEYTPEGTTYKSFETDDRLSFNKVSMSDVSDNLVISATEASQYILDTYQKGENPIKIKIASAKTENKPYTPEPKYVKNKKKLAGQSKVIKKGKKGKQILSTIYVSVNGEIESKSVGNRKILDEGKRATIEKGILGLPKGKDWKTYTGLPVFKDGKEIVITSKKYLGAPYKYGGYSLKYGIDCVQFVRQMYAKYGISLPNNHPGLQHSGVGVPYSKAKKGDIVCYGHHVGIYVGNGKMINAVHKGVKISKVQRDKIKAIRRIAK